MKILDMHCDTIGSLFALKERGEAQGQSLRRNSGHVDLTRLRESHYLIQNFAMFVPLSECDDPWEQVCAMHRYYREELERNQDILAPVLCYQDIARNETAGKVSSLLTVEEGGVCRGEVEKLRELYRMGVRMVTLTWNFDNEIGHPNFDSGLQEKMETAMKAWKAREAGTVQQGQQGIGQQQGQLNTVQQEKLNTVQQGQLYRTEWEEARLAAQAAYDVFMHTPNLTGGLTEKGKELVAEMESLGIIPDVSHLSDAGFIDVLSVTKKPFVASHSNARAVCPNVRNMTDDMIKKLSERGGVMGLNFCPDFLEEKPLGEKNPGTIAAVVRHAKHIVNVGGIDVLGLGSDFDGIPTHGELPGAQSMGLLWEALHEAGFSEGELDKIFYGNVLRVYKDTLK